MLQLLQGQFFPCWEMYYFPKGAIHENELSKILEEFPAAEEEYPGKLLPANINTNWFKRILWKFQAGRGNIWGNSMLHWGNKLTNRKSLGLGLFYSACSCTALRPLINSSSSYWPPSMLPLCLFSVIPPCYKQKGGKTGRITSCFPFLPSIHCKKRLAIFPSPDRMSLTKLSKARNNLTIPRQGESGWWHPGWGLKNR